jgi:hypothetical protein
MYTGKEMKGVMISIEKDSFVKYSANTHNGNIVSDINYVIVPIVSSRTPKDVIYINHPNERKIPFIIDANTRGISIKNNLLGVYKNKEWEFQNECRLAFFIIPNESGRMDNSALNHLVETIIESTPIKKKDSDEDMIYYDLAMEDDIFNDIGITLSPRVTESEKNIIESLINTYCPNAKIINSKYESYFKK